EMSNGKVPQELENILPLKLSSIWQLVKQLDDAAPIEYIALQLDDSWLDTLLKHKYFENYGENYLSFASNGNKVDWYCLDELISTNQHYFSLIIRSVGFRYLDELLYNRIKDKGCLESWGIVPTGEPLNYSMVFI